MISCGEECISKGSCKISIPRGGATAPPNILGPAYICSHGMKHSNQISHGNQTTRGEKCTGLMMPPALARNFSDTNARTHTHTCRRRSWSTDRPFSRHQSSHRAVGQTLHCRQPSFSGCRFLHLELAPWIHRQCIYSTVISTSSENFPVPTFISGHSSAVNIFSGPCSNDDYLGHSKNHDWLIDWLLFDWNAVAWSVSSS